MTVKKSGGDRKERICRTSRFENEYQSIKEIKEEDKEVSLSAMLEILGGTTSRKSTSQTEISLLIQLLFT